MLAAIYKRKSLAVVTLIAAMMPTTLSQTKLSDQANSFISNTLITWCANSELNAYARCADHCKNLNKDVSRFESFCGLGAACECS